MTPAEQTEMETARTLCKGLSPHATARVFNRLTPGIDWRGSRKSRMLTAWATRHTTADPVWVLLKSRTESDMATAVASIKRQMGTVAA